MKILFVGFVWPEPSSSAAGQNILSYVIACHDAGWQTYFCSAATKTPQSTDFAPLNVNTFEVKLNCDSFNEQISKLQPDIVIFDRFLSFEQFASRVSDACPEALLVIDTEDLHGLRQARHLFMKRNSSLDEFVDSEDIISHPNLLYNEVMIRELACIFQADLSLVLSDFEENLLTSHFGLHKHYIRHLPFITNGKQKTIHAQQYTDKQDFVFIGNFRHAPNIDAVRFLKERLWPTIFKALSKQNIGISCHIYGAYLSAKVKQLEDKRLNFFVHGKADDQFKVISQARVMLAPIRFGAGVKGKLLDAMQVNTPSVTTIIGAEGINTERWPGAICANSESFIAQAINLYSDQEKWETANQHGSDILRTQFNHEHNANLFIETIEQAKYLQTENRQQNFLQKLLSQQAFQASKYMTQWIAAKNKQKE